MKKIKKNIQRSKFLVLLIFWFSYVYYIMLLDELSR